MSGADPVFITILRWPEGYTIDSQIEAVVEATGLDPHAAHQRLVKGTPLVIHRVDASIASEVLSPLKARKVMCLGVPEKTMRAVPKPVHLKRLVPAIDAPQPMYLAEPWREEARGLRASDLFLLIRAKLKASIKGETQEDTYNTVGVGFGGHVSVVTVTETYRYDRDQRTEAIDLYLRDGTCYRIFGTKFNFDCLGERRGLTDMENADKLACMVAESAPDCLVDTNFDAFNCPSVFYRQWRTAPKANEIRSDNAAFEFYSAWRFLLTKALVAAKRTA